VDTGPENEPPRKRSVIASAHESLKKSDKKEKKKRRGERARECMLEGAPISRGPEQDTEKRLSGK